MLIPISLLGLFIILGIYGFVMDMIDWNNCICKKNGLPWIRFGRTSQGDRGYRAGNEFIWISWPGVDDSYTKPNIDDK